MSFIELPSKGSLFWGNAVTNFASLPAAGLIEGEIVQTLDTSDLYRWNGSAWIAYFTGSSGTGSVTNVSVVTANGVSAVVVNPTTTPAMTFSLGAITPSSVAATGNVTGLNLSGTNTGDQTITLTSDVTGSGTGSFATTIANNVVTNAKLAQMATHTIKGNKTAGTANAADLTSAEVTALLDLFSSSLQGLTPASGGGTTNFLRADGSWADPLGGVLTIAHGGTNSSTALNNGFVMVSQSGKIVESTLLAYATSGTNLALTAGASTDVAFKIIGAASQSANLMEVRNSAATLIASIGKSGSGNFSPDTTSQIGIQFGQVGGIYSRFGIANTISSGNHQWRVNIDMLFNTRDDAAKEAFALVLDVENNNEYALYNWAVGGNYSNLFSIRGIGAIVGNSGSGTVYSTGDFLSRFTTYTASSSKIGQVIQGASSQTADLWQARNSSSTVLSKFDAAGYLVIGSGSLTASTALEVSSTTGAFLVPRMTTTQKNALTAANGMIVYDTDLGKFQGYEAGAWTSFI